MRLLERERQLARLHEALAATVRGRGGCVLVRGAAGSGKTSLVAAFADECDRSAEVTWGYCDPLGTPIPFGAVWDIGRRDPALRAALDADDRPAVFDRVLHLLTGTDVPTVLVIEDAHWADEATLDLVAFLSRRIATQPGLLIVTYRESATRGGRALRRVIGAMPRAVIRRVDVGPLSREAIASLAAGSERSADEIFALTGGNPLFVTEVLAARDDAVPRSIRDLVRGRLADLSERARELLSLIAVMPGSMPIEVLEYCGGDLAAAEEAEEHELIDVLGNSVAFRHELVRLAVEGSLSAARRRRLHRRVLTGLEHANAEPYRIVHHAHRSGDAEAVMRFAPAAATRAAAVDSHWEAVEYFRLMDGHLDGIGARDRAEILLGWSRAELTVGDPQAGAARAAEAVAACRELDDAAALGRGLLQLGYAQWFAADPAAAANSVDDAIAVLSELPPDRVLARALSERAALFGDDGRHADAMQFAERAHDLACEIGDQGVAAHALATQGRAIAEVGYPDGTDLLAASARTAQEHGYVHHSLRASIIHAKIALEHRDLPTAAALITHGLELAVDRQRTSLELDLRALAAQRQLLAGRFDLAAAELRYELRSERSSSRPVDHAWLTARWRSISGTGDPTDLLARAWTAACTTNEAVSRAQVTAASLEHAWLHHTDTPLADEAADLLERMVDLGHPWLAGELAYWLWRFDRLDGAPAVSAEPYRRQIEGEWNEAADRWNRLGLPYERAVALADGDVDAQMSAIEILDSIGAHPMANRVREEIRQRTGRRIPRPRQSPAGPRGGLTERQHEVLTLLGERLSNAEIADRLFISTRTAEHHVAAVMTRLGAGTRSEAVDLASERGILRTEDCLNGSDALAPD